MANIANSDFLDRLFDGQYPVHYMLANKAWLTSKNTNLNTLL